MKTFTDGGLFSCANETRMTYSIPEISDVLVAYATIEGQDNSDNFLYG